MSDTIYREPLTDFLRKYDPLLEVANDLASLAANNPRLSLHIIELAMAYAIHATHARIDHANKVASLEPIRAQMRDWSGFR